jgi:hypothetical protein
VIQGIPAASRKRDSVRDGRRDMVTLYCDLRRKSRNFGPDPVVHIEAFTGPFGEDIWRLKEIGRAVRGLRFPISTAAKCLYADAT